VSGSITREGVSALARAHTTSGSLKADIKSIAPDQPASISSTSGSINLEIQSGVNANLETSSTSGSLRIEDDFGINVQRDGPSGRASGQIGAGGPKLTVTTVSGNIRLRR
jgi:hypothetical protein